MENYVTNLNEFHTKAVFNDSHKLKLFSLNNYAQKLYRLKFMLCGNIVLTFEIFKLQPQTKKVVYNGLKISMSLFEILLSKLYPNNIALLCCLMN